MSTQFEDLLRSLGEACQQYADLRKQKGTLESVLDLKELDVFDKAMELCRGPKWKEKLTEGSTRSTVKTLIPSPEPILPPSGPKSPKDDYECFDDIRETNT